MGPSTHVKRRALLADAYTMNFNPGPLSLGADFSVVFLSIGTTTHQSISQRLRLPRPCTQGCVGWGGGLEQTGMGSDAMRPSRGPFCL